MPCPLLVPVEQELSRARTGWGTQGKAKPEAWSEHHKDLLEWSQLPSSQGRTVGTGGSSACSVLCFLAMEYRIPRLQRETDPVLM